MKKKIFLFALSITMFPTFGYAMESEQSTNSTNRVKLSELASVLSQTFGHGEQPSSLPGAVATDETPSSNEPITGDVTASELANALLRSISGGEENATAAAEPGVPLSDNPETSSSDTNKNCDDVCDLGLGTVEADSLIDALNNMNLCEDTTAVAPTVTDDADDGSDSDPILPYITPSVSLKSKVTPIAVGDPSDGESEDGSDFDEDDSAQDTSKSSIIKGLDLAPSSALREVSPDVSGSESLKLSSADYAVELRKAWNQALPVLCKSSGVIDVNGDTFVVGDLHGDLQTFLKIRNYLTMFLKQGNCNVVFLGDIMDRGNNSAATLLELLKFFNNYQGQNGRGHVYIIRGNHETMAMYNCPYALGRIARDEPQFKYISNDELACFFDSLPYAAVINKTTLAVHGGVPPRDRWDSFFSGVKYPESCFTSQPTVYYSVWSDYEPEKDDQEGLVLEESTSRGGGTYCFNEQAAKEFIAWGQMTLCQPGLKYMIRGHQIMLDDDGHIRTFHQSPSATVTTILSSLENQGFEMQRSGAKIAAIFEKLKPQCYATVYDSKLKPLHSGIHF